MEALLGGLLTADGVLRHWVVVHRWAPLDALMLAVSTVGRVGLVWLALGFVAWRLDRRRAAGVWQMVLAASLATTLAEAVVKPIVHRPRPFEVVADAPLIGGEPGEYSFPSGHAASSFAAAFALSHVWPTARLPFWALAVLITLSRVYIGVHYPLDVIAGALLGLAVGYFVIGRTRWRIETRKPRDERPADAPGGMGL